MDKRTELTPGYKFHDQELKGIPLRIEIGPKDIEKQKVVLAKRYNKEKFDLVFSQLDGKIGSVLDQIQREMLESARKILTENTLCVKNYSEFKSALEKGGFLKTQWCGKEECEEKIKEETGADIRVIPFDSENAEGKCIYCGEQSKTVPLFARGYQNFSVKI